jgi:hypothetical protein|tara:strand:+ start:934 stop:1218 length:285 start_codon:yes stop_codon:yes gene_type:complete
MVSRKGRTNGLQDGMKLPDGITSSRPSTLWKIIKVIKDDGAGTKAEIIERMRAKWKNFPTLTSLSMVLHGRIEIFIKVDNERWDLKEEIRDAMD